MSVSITTKSVIVVLLLALLVVAPIPAGAQTQEDVDGAEAAKEQAYQDLMEANQAVGSAISELEGIECLFTMKNEATNPGGSAKDRPAHYYWVRLPVMNCSNPPRSEKEKTAHSRPWEW